MKGINSEEHFISAPVGIIEAGRNLSAGIYLVQLFNGSSVINPFKVVKVR
jgi:hypothetical protein